MSVRDNRAGKPSDSGGGSGPERNAGAVHRPRRLPLSARAILRLCPSPEHRTRALADLTDLYERNSEAHGFGYARRACVRESALVVWWYLWDRVRRGLESRARARSDGSRERRAPWLTSLGQDIRFGARALARRPGFTFAASGLLALGIGANVAIFTLADRLFFEQPPLVESPGELVRIFRSWAPGAGGAVSYPDYQEYRDGATTLSGLMAYGGPYAVSVRGGDRSLPGTAIVVTANFFDVLGVRPAAGRFFLPEENATAGTHPVAVVSYEFLRNRMGTTIGPRGDQVSGTGERADGSSGEGARAGTGGAATVGSGVLGTDVVLNGSVFTVIGVAPDGFRGLTPTGPAPDFYIPILMRDAIVPSTTTAWRERLPNMRDRWLAVVGRLAPGATLETLQAEASTIADRIRVLDGDNGEAGETALVTADFRWNPSTRGGLLSLTRVLLVTVALLLAVAIANVAILLLARASSRDHEIGIRSAIGAGRARVARQMLVESGLLGLAGCVVGVVLSIGAARVAGSLLPPLALTGGFIPNAGAITLAVGLSMAAALLAGAFPALRAAGTDVAGLIHGRDSGAGGARVRDGLVVVQVALSLVLVAGAALFSRSLANANALDLGFDDRGVLFVGTSLANHGYEESTGRVFIGDALRRIEAIPGVALATTSRQVPFRGDWSTDLDPWRPEGFADGRDLLTVGLNIVGPGYFDAMGVPILRGRAFTDADREGSQPVVIVNETFARLAYPDGDALGQSVPLASSEDSRTIVGIARDATYYELAEESWPQLYAPSGQSYSSTVNFMIKTAGDPSALVAQVQRAIHDVDPDIAFSSVETLSSVRAEQTARLRASAGVVGLSGIIALLLASAGLYGVMSYRITRSTREIGVRMALGASRRLVASDVLRRGLALVIVGAGFGLAAALALGRFVEGMVFGVPARDPVSLLVAPTVMIAVAVIAVLEPARRAMRVDPMRAVRAD